MDLARIWREKFNGNKQRKLTQNNKENIHDTT